MSAVVINAKVDHLGETSSEYLKWKIEQAVGNMRGDPPTGFKPDSGFLDND